MRKTNSFVILVKEDVFPTEPPPEKKKYKSQPLKAPKLHEDPSTRDTCRENLRTRFREQFVENLIFPSRGRFDGNSHRDYN